MRVKICGLHPARDVQLCIDLGVDFLGFIFYAKSPRNVDLEEIKKLRGYNKFNSKFVAVTVNPSDEFIKRVVLGNFDFIQLHGSETKERVNEIKSTGLKIIKAIKAVNKKPQTSFTEAAIPSVIRPKYITNSNGFLTGLRNLTIESAPTIPIDNAMLLEIRLVITKVIGGKRIKVKVLW